MGLFHLLFSFSGRANRAKIWLFVLLSFVAWTIVIVAAISAIGADKIDAFGSRPDNTNLGALFDAAVIPLLMIFLFILVGFYCSLAVVAKRLHDRGRSAWWIVVFYFIPGFLNGLGTSLMSGTEQSDSAAIAGVLSLVALGLTLWAFVELYCLRGTVGDNQYGPDPLAGRV
jgi:uncharacterized membrane protein YhaH (DUF805 family)